ncbi:hypothetical protein DR72_4652 [Klebsiella aerogenes]|nr:hypothetical protein DR72_4652 [Klebsiella aerogenes]VDZ70384.1 Uncharacterised protein [Klebsiella aerogenes]
MFQVTWRRHHDDVRDAVINQSDGYLFCYLVWLRMLQILTFPEGNLAITCDICHIFDLFRKVLIHFHLTVLEQAYTQCGILFLYPSRTEGN